MRYRAEVVIMPHKELLDPQGKTVKKNLPNIGVHDVEDVRIGKHILLTLEASSHEDARQKVEKACQKILVNQIMESYSYELSEEDN